MRVDELIKKLEEIPPYAIVRVLAPNKVDGHTFYTFNYAEKVEVSPVGDSDDYLERYINIK